MKLLIRNSAKCLSCGVEIESKETHHFEMCDCPNELFVDGGLAYIRRGAVDLSKVEETSLYEDVTYIGRLIKHSQKYEDSYFLVVEEEPTNDARRAHLYIAPVRNQEKVLSIPLSLPLNKRMNYSFV